MSKYYEDLSTGNARSFESYFLTDDLNVGLTGKILGVEPVDADGLYHVVYQDDSGKGYVFSMTPAGNATLIENHIDNTRVNEVLSSGSYNLASDVTVTDPEVTPVDKTVLYGTKVMTRVEKIGGAEDVEDNWKIFYVDSNNVYLIYGDYYPNEKLQNIDDISITRSTYGKYAISSPFGMGRQTLVNYLTSESNWTEIANALTQTGATFANKTLKVTGAPTLDMWLKSWNEKNGDTLGCYYVTQEEVDSGKEFEQYEEESPLVVPVAGAIMTRNQNVTPVEYVYSLPRETVNETEGYLSGNGETGNGYTDNLYYPRRSHSDEDTSETKSTFGYWLADISANNMSAACGIYDTGAIGFYFYSMNFCAVRPIIQISKTDFTEATGIEVD